MLSHRRCSSSLLTFLAADRDCLSSIFNTGTTISPILLLVRSAIGAGSADVFDRVRTIINYVV